MKKNTEENVTIESRERGWEIFPFVPNFNKMDIHYLVEIGKRNFNRRRANIELYIIGE